MGTITRNFSYCEFEQSDYAYTHGIVNIISTMSVRGAIKELTTTILQPLRDAWGKPITISSGYRCEELNKAVGGSKTSAHMTGYAADIQCDAESDQDLFNAFAKNFLQEQGIPFDQCITEQAGETKWLHIGLYNNKGEQRRQMFEINA